MRLSLETEVLEDDITVLSIYLLPQVGMQRQHIPAALLRQAAVALDPSLAGASKHKRSQHSPGPLLKLVYIQRIFVLKLVGVCSQGIFSLP